MREITVDGKELRVMGCPMALLYYKQEFGGDLVKDVTQMGGLDGVVLMRAAWAMAKAGSGKPKEFPSFTKWVEGLESFDVSDGPGLTGPLWEEINQGFFRKRHEENKRKHK